MTGRINNHSLIILLASLLLAVSCNSDIVFTNNFSIAGKTWRLSDIPVFEVAVTDTIAANNIWLILRTGSDYPFRNIHLFVTAATPEGKVITDTLQFNLADEKGVWYGKGFGDIHSLNLPYKSNIYFPSKGIYIFKIQHGMRIEDLKGVYDIGLKVEKIKKQTYPGGKT